MTQLSTQSSLSGAVSGYPSMHHYDRSSNSNTGYHPQPMMYAPPSQHVTPSPRAARQIMLEQADQTTIAHQMPPEDAPESSAQGGEQQDSDGRRRVPCMYPECDRRFVSDYTLRVHMEAHKAKPRVRYPCTAGCSESFSRQHDRLRHEVGQHGKICEFICDDCGCFFSTKKTFNNHKCPVASGKVRWAQ
ncbi:hypothetical protein FIBSPDRAFT_855617 [Athelia psychrophila]|uniref:C2H2-type domain-containing protein n=1 Tax=Athelia psychrophila TaxID=1759441 RepID=A0A166P4H1_9AGAM|nr:hypothetical protein FIBSPDRAFT_855617 [Fibularhizoctonia sp. CBS 109695]